MADEVSRLSLAVDSTQVKAADAALDKMAASGGKAATSADALAQAARGSASALSQTAQGATASEAATSRTAAAQRSLQAALVASDRASAQAASSALRLARANDQYEATLQAGPPTAAALAQALVRLELAQTGQAAAALKAQAAQDKVAAAQKGYENSLRGSSAATKLNAYQAQQLGFQLNDLFVQIASGQSPVTALVQQGSQLSGTFGGLRGTLAALGTVFTATRVAAGGVLAVVGGLAFAFNEGQQQSQALQRSLILTGNAAGITEGQFNSMARSIADATRTTIGSTRETLQGLVASGRFSGEALNQAATAAQLMSKVTGQSAEDILKSFVSAADGVGKFAEQANRQYNFLTAAQVAYIKRLEETGQSQKALETVFTALNGRLTEAAGKVGTLERGYLALKSAVSSAADALLSIGRDKTPEERLASIAAQIKALETRRSTGSPQATQARLENLREEQKTIEETLGLQRRSAAAAAERAQREQAATQFDKLKEQSLTKQEQLTKALADANKLADAAGASAADRAKVLADIFERFGGAELRRAQLEKSLSSIRDVLDAQVSAFQNAELILDAVRSAGLASDRDFYAAKRAFIDADTAARVQALEAESAAISASVRTSKERIEADKQIAGNVAEIARLRAAAAAKGIVLDVQERSAVDALTRAYTEARIEAELFIERARRGDSLDVAGVGRGDEARKRAQGLFEIEERYGQKRERLDAEFANGRLRGKRELYDREVALTEEFQAKEIALFNETADAKLLAESRWENGANRAFENYVAAAANAAAQTEQLFSSAFRGAEDVAVSFITKGKADFKGFADSIVADILRIIIRQQIANALVGAIGSGGGVGAGIGAGIGAAFGAGAASGGPVTRGGIFPVNEKGGPGELLNVGSKQYLLAAENGRVMPQKTGGKSVSQVNHFHFPGPVDRRSQQQVAAAAGRGVSLAVSRND